MKTVQMNCVRAAARVTSVEVVSNDEIIYGRFGRAKKTVTVEVTCKVAEWIKTNTVR